MTEEAVQDDLDEMSECHELLEKAIASELSAFDDRTKADPKILDKAASSYFSKLQAHKRWKISSSFPRIARSSLFLACYALLESRLDEYCMGVRIDDSLSIALADISGKGITRAQRFLRKAACRAFPDDTREWNDILVFGIIRNLLMHADGEMDNDKNWSKLTAFAEANPGLVKVRASHTIELQKRFVPHAIKIIGSFFGRLHARQPLEVEVREVKITVEAAEGSPKWLREHHP